jgi:hypothetical protein
VVAALSIEEGFRFGAGESFTISGAFFKFHVLLSMLIFHDIVTRIHIRSKLVRPASLEITPEAKVRVEHAPTRVIQKSAKLSGIHPRLAQRLTSRAPRGGHDPRHWSNLLSSFVTNRPLARSLISGRGNTLGASVLESFQGP